MELHQLIDDLDYRMQGVTRPKVIQILNRTYLDIWSTDREDAIFLNYIDGRFPYPILHPGFLDGELQQNPEPIEVEPSDPSYPSVTANEIFRDWYSYGKSYGRVVEGHLVDTNQNEIEFNISSIPIKCRKVKDLFTIKNSITVSNFEEKHVPLLTVLDDPFFKDNDFVKIPHTSSKHWDGADIKFNGAFNYKVPIFVEFYYMPPEITGESTPIFMNLEEDYDLLVDGAMAKYEKEVNGRSDDVIAWRNGALSDFVRRGNPSLNNSRSRRFKTRYI
jgi:hypothetical protein